MTTVSDKGVIMSEMGRKRQGEGTLNVGSLNEKAMAKSEKLNLNEIL